MRIAVQAAQANPAPLSDETAAITALKRGEAAPLEVLVRLYQLRAVRTAHLILGKRAAAEDVVADAFIRAFEHIAQFDERRAFGPWFYRIVVNGALMWLRRNGRTQSWDDVTFEALPDTDAVTPSEHVIQRERQGRVIAAIRALPPEQRAAIVLRYCADMDEREIAQTLSVPLGTAKWRLHWAKRRLRNALAADFLPQGKWES